MMCTHIMTCTPCPQVEMSNQPIRQMQNTIAEGLRHHQALMIRVEANDFQEHCMGNHVKTLRLQRLDRLMLCTHITMCTQNMMCIYISGIFNDVHSCNDVHLYNDEHHVQSSVTA